MKTGPDFFMNIFYLDRADKTKKVVLSITVGPRAERERDSVDRDGRQTILKLRERKTQPLDGSPLTLISPYSFILLSTYSCLPIFFHFA